MAFQEKSATARYQFLCKLLHSLVLYLSSKWIENPFAYSFLSVFTLSRNNPEIPLQLYVLMYGFVPTLCQVHHALVLRPRRVPENVGVNKKCDSSKK